MAYWTRGSWGMSRCSDCGFEIPYSEYRRNGTPDPDECPHCGRDMENGYGNVQKAISAKVLPALGKIRNQVVPETWGVYVDDEMKMWENAFKEFLDKMHEEHTKGTRQTGR